MRNLQEEALEFKRKELHKSYSMLTTEQQSLFDRLCPNGIDNSSEDKIDNMFDVCERTFRKRKQK